MQRDRLYWKKRRKKRDRRSWPGGGKGKRMDGIRTERNRQARAAYDRSQEVLREVRTVVKGKDACVEKAFSAILAGGHILIEDVPGVGKTTLAVAFSRAMTLENQRVQFTPDVQPSDILGFSMYHKDNCSFSSLPAAPRSSHRPCTYHYTDNRRICKVRAAFHKAALKPLTPHPDWQCRYADSQSTLFHPCLWSDTCGRHALFLSPYCCSPFHIRTFYMPILPILYANLSRN